jgi:hypothetical protein
LTIKWLFLIFQFIFVGHFEIGSFKAKMEGLQNWSQDKTTRYYHFPSERKTTEQHAESDHARSVPLQGSHFFTLW